MTWTISATGASEPKVFKGFAVNARIKPHNEHEVEKARRIVNVRVIPHCHLLQAANHESHSHEKSLFVVNEQGSTVNMNKRADGRHPFR